MAWAAGGEILDPDIGKSQTTLQEYCNLGYQDINRSQEIRCRDQNTGCCSLRSGLGASQIPSITVTHRENPRVGTEVSSDTPLEVSEIISLGSSRDILPSTLLNGIRMM